MACPLNQKRGIFLNFLLVIHCKYDVFDGVSATISSIDVAGDVLAPGQPVSFVRDDFKKVIVGDVLLPEKDTATFRHLGRRLPQIIAKIKAVNSTLFLPTLDLNRSSGFNFYWLQRIFKS